MSHRFLAHVYGCESTRFAKEVEHCTTEPIVLFNVWGKSAKCPWPQAARWYENHRNNWYLSAITEVALSL